MSDLKRDEVKYIRDISKSAYKKESECYICGATEELDFHHFSSMTHLWNAWKRKNKIIIRNVEDILMHREDFRDDHHTEIYEDTITLCRLHHRERLHKVYGKVPALATSEKQKRWVEKQKIKLSNK